MPGDSTRVVAEWSLNERAHPGLEPPTVGEGDIFVEVTRPRDLVTLQTVWHGFTVAPDGPPVRLTAVEGAMVTVHLPFQHAQEHADVLKVGGDPVMVPNPKDPILPPQQSAFEKAESQQPPVGYRAARSSRLVFDVPPGTEVALTSRGILNLLPTLTLRVPRLADGGTGPAAYPDTPQQDALPDGSWMLGVGVLATLKDGVVSLKRVTVAQAAKHPTTPMQREALLIHLQTYLTPVAVARLNRRFGDDVVPIAPSPDAPPVQKNAIFSEAPAPDQTAIEAPFRLVLSPDAGARWVHASEPAPANADQRNIELWHSRLGRPVATDDATPGTVTDAPSENRIVRAVWTRDRDHLTAAQWQSPTSDTGNENDGAPTTGPLAPPSGPDQHPFTSSLNRSDRHRIVRQSAETWIGKTGPIDPAPVEAKRLWLSALGASLDLHGHWDTAPYSAAHIPSLVAWDHIAQFGRDQYVRVVYPGYVYPLGHHAVRVKITERKIRSGSAATGPSATAGADPVARLVQWNLIVVTQPFRTYEQTDLPFIDAYLGPAATPILDMPDNTGTGSTPGFNTWFWPSVGGRKFRFHVDAHDRAGDPFSFELPLLWVAEHIDDDSGVWGAYSGANDGSRVIDLGGRRIALYSHRAGPGSPTTVRLPVQKIRLGGVSGASNPRNERMQFHTSEPHLSTADVVVEAASRLSGTPAITIGYHPKVAQGPLGDNGVWAVVATADSSGTQMGLGAAFRTLDDPLSTVLPGIRFGEPAQGTAPGHSSETGGGFVSPSQAIAGLSTLHGTVPGIASTGFPNAADPAAAAAALALGDAFPKLFGLVSLVDLLGLEAELPKIVTTLLGPIEQIQSVAQSVRDAVAGAQDAAKHRVVGLVDTADAKIAQLKKDADAAVNAAGDLLAATDRALATIEPLLSELFAGAVPDVNAVQQKFSAMKTAFGSIPTKMRALGAGVLPPFARAKLADAADAIDRVLAGGKIVEDVFQAAKLASELASGAKQLDLHFDWSPPLKDWPTDKPVLQFLPESLPTDKPGQAKVRTPLKISVAGRAGLATTPSLDIRAELTDFRLNLLPVEPLVVIPFDHLSFHAGTSGKGEVDVVMGEVEFVGLLSFVQTIKDLIPLDGFSDPPNVSVDASGLTAGYTLALPSVAVGVFSLSNMSLSADVRVPFLGDGMSVGFGFCSRERPFTLAVAFLGGGGWLGLRLNPQGLELLEMGLEAGAYLSVDFGVASGSVSAAVGIYLRLETDKGSLTGYFRLRGQVNVLGLITASIELAMSLTYDWNQKKVIGRASITVQVEVMCFSQSVTISAEKKFAGSNSDPTIAELLDGTTAWEDYMAAFAKEDA